MNKFLKTIALASLIFQVSLAYAGNTVSLAGKTFTEIINQTVVEARISELGQQITSYYKNSERRLVFVGVLGGATFFLTSLMQKVALPCYMEFLKVSSYNGGLATTGSVQLQFDSLAEKDLTGCDVIITEDIVETGLTMEWIINHFKSKNPASIKIASLLLKKDCLKAAIPDIDYLGFEVEKDAFVVGYGMDYKELGRNLPGIYELVTAPAA